MTKLTAKVRKQLYDYIRGGLPVDVACKMAGIGKQTFYDWIHKGREQEKGIYRDFLNSLDDALAHFEARLLSIIDRAAETTWQAAAWRAERRWPQKYSNRWRDAEKPQSNPIPPVVKPKEDGE